jgi:hypothetical protein
MSEKSLLDYSSFAFNNFDASDWRAHSLNLKPKIKQDSRNKIQISHRSHLSKQQIRHFPCIFYLRNNFLIIWGSERTCCCFHVSHDNGWKGRKIFGWTCKSSRNAYQDVKQTVDLGYRCCELWRQPDLSMVSSSVGPKSRQHCRNVKVHEWRNLFVGTPDKMSD